MIKEFFRYGLKHMKHRQLRSWLTILGVVIGIAAIVSLVSIGAGLENAIVEQFSALGADKIRVVPEGLTGPPAGVEGLTDEDVDTIENVIGVDWVSGMTMNYAAIEYDNQEQIMFVKGYPGELTSEGKIDIDVSLVEGEWYSESDTTSVVIGNSVAYEVFEDDIMLKNNIMIDDEKFEVIGILEQIGDQGSDQVIYMELDYAKEKFEMDDKINAIVIAVEDGEDMEELVVNIEKDLEKKRGDDNFDVFTPEQLMEQLGSILSVVQFLLGGIAAISLVVGGIGIMNSMYTSVLERTRQIGVMKAVGASRWEIMLIFMIEAGLIGVVGGLAGVLIGVGFAFSVQGVAALLGFSLLKIGIEWSVIAFALVFAFVIGMISGILPAYRAASLKAVEALRWE
jgi:putative ABC transport system permease protein